MRIDFDDIKESAKKNKLPILSNVDFAKGKYCCEKFKEGFNFTQIFREIYIGEENYKKTLDNLTKTIERTLRHGVMRSGASGIARTLQGIGDGENYNNYEIRILNTSRDKIYDPTRKDVNSISIELTIGEKNETT